MMSIDDCKKQAEICRKWAADAHSTEAKESFTWVANAWDRLGRSFDQGFVEHKQVTPTLHHMRWRSGVTE